MRRLGWTLLSNDSNAVEQTQLVTGVAYGAAPSLAGVAAANQPGGAATSLSQQSFSTSGIIPVQFNTQIPIDATVNPFQAVLGPNLNRGVLVLQNLSTATLSGDVAPTMYIGFSSPPIIGHSFGLLPGVGIWLDRAVPVDAIFVGWGGEIDTSSSVIVQGFVGSAAILSAS
jgi:hypothetical protein